MQFIFIILTFYCFAAGLQEQEEIHQEWLNFKIKYGKTYKRSLEEHIRYTKFEQNVKIIKNHNKKFENGEESYEMGINPYTDMDSKDIKKLLMSERIMNKRLQNVFVNASLLQSPALPLASFSKNFDWRENGAITAVKNQLSCGSCWAFSTTGALEAHYYLKYNKSIILSEQNLVDCVNGNRGCRGGWMHTSFDYIHKNGGLNSEISYPYEALQRNCRYQRNHVAASCNGYTALRSGDEQQLLEAVATRGPVAVAFYTLPSFLLYKSGIYDVKNCSSHSLHAVLVVGYGSENGHDYWLVKNSWGTEWGDGGYVKMSRNRNNQCGIASWASYPLV